MQKNKIEQIASFLLIYIGKYIESSFVKNKFCSIKIFTKIKICIYMLIDFGYYIL